LDSSQSWCREGDEACRRKTSCQQECNLLTSHGERCGCWVCCVEVNSRHMTFWLWSFGRRDVLETLRQWNLYTVCSEKLLLESLNHTGKTLEYHLFKVLRLWTYEASKHNILQWRNEIHMYLDTQPMVWVWESYCLSASMTDEEYSRKLFESSLYFSSSVWWL